MKNDAIDKIERGFKILKDQGLKAKNPDQSTAMTRTFAEDIDICHQKGFDEKDIETMFKSAQKFESFLESLKTSDNASLIESIQEGYTLIEGMHKYAVVKANIDEPLRSDILELAGKIPDEELSGKGRTTQPHTTVMKLPFTPTISTVKEFDKLKGKGLIKPFDVKLLKVNAFHKPTHEVLYVEVESQGLIELRNSIKKNIYNKSGKFNPHVTLAFMNLGETDKYIGSDALMGRTFKVNEIELGGKDGSSIIYPLI